MLRNHTLRSALISLAGLTVLATSACSDSSAGSPVGPDVTSATPSTDDAAFMRRARGVAITNLQLSSDLVILGGAATQYSVTLHNYGDSDSEGLVVQGFLQAAGRREVVHGTAHTLACPIAGAPLPAGNDCVMVRDISTDPNLTLGPGTFTVELQQFLPGGKRKVLDSRTVDVQILQQVEIPR